MSWSKILGPAVALALVVGPVAFVATPDSAGGIDTASRPVDQPGDAPAEPVGGHGEARWRWPFNPRPEVMAPFAAPASRWGPGHRGIDLAAGVGRPVTAVEAGTVTHRGRIAGRSTITVTHADGLRSTYEPVGSDLSVGDRVGRGERLGTVTAEPGHCAPATCVHVGALRGRDYLDPRPLFGGVRVILLPLP